MYNGTLSLVLHIGRGDERKWLYDEEDCVVLVDDVGFKLLYLECHYFENRNKCLHAVI